MDVNLTFTHVPPLHNSLRLGETAITELILAREDVHLNTTDLYGMSPAHVAVNKGQTEDLDLLLAVGLDRGIDLNLTDPQGKTPLHRAAEFGSLEMVTALLNRSSADCLMKDPEGNTAKDLAERNGHMETAEILRSWETTKVLKLMTLH